MLRESRFGHLPWQALLRLALRHEACDEHSARILAEATLVRAARVHDGDGSRGTLRSGTPQRRWI